MFKIIYIIGLLLSLFIQGTLFPKYWKNSTRLQKVLTIVAWIPFMTAISWLGVAMVGSAALYCKFLDNVKDSERPY